MTEGTEESYTCPKCGMTSYHPEDVKHEYCANCHRTKSELEFIEAFGLPEEKQGD